MSINHFRCPNCSKDLPYPDQYAGKKAECPKCGHRITLPATRTADEESSETEAVEKANGVDATPFPVLGHGIAWAAVITGGLLILGGIALTLWTLIADGDFKPAGLVVFTLPGILWVLGGRLLLRRHARFVWFFWGFLQFNLLIGVFFTTQARSLGRGSETSLFAMIGLGFIVTYLVFQLLVAFLIRDLRRT